MTTTKNDLTCLACGATGPDVEFPIFPLTGVAFGEICAKCDESSPWLGDTLICFDCEEEISQEEAHGNRKYGDPRCEDCFVDYKYGGES